MKTIFPLILIGLVLLLNACGGEPQTAEPNKSNGKINQESSPQIIEQLIFDEVQDNNIEQTTCPCGDQLGNPFLEKILTQMKTLNKSFADADPNIEGIIAVNLETSNQRSYLVFSSSFEFQEAPKQEASIVRSQRLVAKVSCDGTAWKVASVLDYGILTEGIVNLDMAIAQLETAEDVDQRAQLKSAILSYLFIDIDKDGIYELKEEGSYEFVDKGRPCVTYTQIYAWKNQLPKSLFNLESRTKLCHDMILGALPKGDPLGTQYRIYGYADVDQDSTIEIAVIKIELIHGGGSVRRQVLDRSQRKFSDLVYKFDPKQEKYLEAAELKTGLTEEYMEEIFRIE